LKRRRLVKHLAAHGCVSHREGAKHPIFINTATGKKTTVPRHVEIDNRLARAICSQLGIPPV
jgi:mRNA interferase HicA